MSDSLGEVSRTVSSSCPPVHVSFSVVSHRHGRFIDLLLEDLESLSLPSYEILLTLNVAEDEGFIEKHRKLPLRVVRNAKPQGFGENHNHAFTMAQGAFFIVLNPDVRLVNFSLAPILALLADERVGISAPAVFSSHGQLQDSARRFPTILRLLARKLAQQQRPDYLLIDTPVQVDWVAGMFMAFRREVFAAVRGFDERFFMYLEDADICDRASRAGWAVMVHPLARITHDAQRASRRNLRHVGWHLSSAVRYLIGRRFFTPRSRIP